MIKPEITDFYDYITNYEIIRDLMLPDETFLVYKAVDQGLFINKHLFFEYTNFSKNQDFYMKQNFSEFNEKIRKGFES